MLALGQVVEVTVWLLEFLYSVLETSDKLMVFAAEVAVREEKYCSMEF